MELSKLTDYQLYAIIQNDRLDASIRNSANDELNKRKLTIEQLAEIIREHDALYQVANDDPLEWRYKILLIIFPFAWLIHIVAASKFLSIGQKRKWKEYWLFFCLGLLIWTLAIFILGKFFLNIPR